MTLIWHCLFKSEIIKKGSCGPTAPHQKQAVKHCPLGRLPAAAEAAGQWSVKAAITSGLLDIPRLQMTWCQQCLAYFLTTACHNMMNSLYLIHYLHRLKLFCSFHKYSENCSENKNKQSDLTALWQRRSLPTEWSNAAHTQTIFVKMHCDS